MAPPAPHTRRRRTSSPPTSPVKTHRLCTSRHQEAARGLTKQSARLRRRPKRGPKPKPTLSSRDPHARPRQSVFTRPTLQRRARNRKIKNTPRPPPKNPCDDGLEDQRARAAAHQNRHRVPRGRKVCPHTRHTPTVPAVPDPPTPVGRPRHQTTTPKAVRRSDRPLKRRAPSGRAADNEMYPASEILRRQADAVLEGSLRPTPRRNKLPDVGFKPLHLPRHRGIRTDSETLKTRPFGLRPHQRRDRLTRDPLEHLLKKEIVRVAVAVFRAWLEQSRSITVRRPLLTPAREDRVRGRAKTPDIPKTRAVRQKMPETNLAGHPSPPGKIARHRRLQRQRTRLGEGSSGARHESLPHRRDEVAVGAGHRSTHRRIH